MPDAPFGQTVRDLVRESYETAKDHGFWDNEEVAESIPSKLMLIVSEAAEALESYRDPAVDEMVKVPVEMFEWLVDQAEWYGAPTGDKDAAAKASEARSLLDKWKAKPKGFDIELADVLIRVFDLAGRKGIDLDQALRTKMLYNKGRPYRHGKLL